MVNVPRLKGKIVEAEMSIPEVAEKLGIDKATLYRKLNDGGASLTVKDITRLSSILKLSFDDVNSIFFSF